MNFDLKNTTSVILILRREDISRPLFLLTIHGFLRSLEAVSHPAPPCPDANAIDPRIKFPTGLSIPAEAPD
jgi:hypothetical protein